MWDSRNQEWTFSAEEMSNFGDLDETPGVDDLFKPLVIKTTTDCNLANNFEPKKSAQPTQPPSIPQ